MTFWQKFYVWAITLGRYLIIGTELIVLIGFFYKFKLDNDLANVQSQIVLNTGIMKTNYSQEVTIRQYQDQAVAEERVLALQQKMSSAVTHTLSLFPSSVTIASATFSQIGTITVNASVAGTGSTQLAEIQSLNTTVKADTLYTDVNLSNIESNVSQGETSFVITMNTTL